MYYVPIFPLCSTELGVFLGFQASLLNFAPGTYDLDRYRKESSLPDRHPVTSHSQSKPDEWARILTGDRQNRLLLVTRRYDKSSPWY